MQEFNLAGELVIDGSASEEYLNTEGDLTTYFFEQSIDLGELDASIYELGSPDGIYASSGLRDPSMLTKNEEKNVLESIFQGIEQKIFQRVNQLTGKFMYLHGQGLLGTLGGIIDLVVGVIDLIGITDDIIQGITGFFSGSGFGAISAGVTAVLGGIFGNARVKEAISKGAERSNKFAEDTSKRVSQVLEYETEVTNQGDGHRQSVVTGVDSIVAGKSIIHANSSITGEAPLITHSADTYMLNSKTEKHVNDYLSVQSQHIDYTIDDSLTINSNVFSTTSNSKRDVSRQSVLNSEAHEQIATNELHLQAGVYGNQSAFGVEAELVPKQDPKLTLSSTKDIYVYAGNGYYLKSKGIYTMDCRYFFANMGTANIASIIGRPRQIAKVDALPNPETIKTEVGLSDSITIANGNSIPVSNLGNKPTTTSTYDFFTS